MEKHTFYFKQFSVRHDKCAMKVGTDGVLLGAWTSIASARRILEIGAGSGLIALMLAQRSSDEARIDGVEISEECAMQARENVACSKWSNRINIFTNALQRFEPAYKYDLIVTNPPYFINGTAPPSNDRQQARHATGLSAEDLLKKTASLLADDGIFSVILPTKEGAIFQALAASYDLYCSRRTAFYSRPEKPPERWLLEFIPRIEAPMVEDRICLYRDTQQWSEEYRKLVKDFYLGGG